jgi:hypothetical protein
MDNNQGFEITGDSAALFAALAAAQGSFKPVLRTRTNPFFKSKYADLSDVIDATRSALSGNGLCVFQPASRDQDGVWYVTTTLAHAGGGRLAAVATLPKVDDWQKLGAAITYCRRYQLSAMLNVASEDDDDGGAVKDDSPSPATKKYEEKAKTRATPPPLPERDPAREFNDREVAKARLAAKEQEWEIDKANEEARLQSARSAPVDVPPHRLPSTPPPRQPTIPPPPPEVTNPYPAYAEPADTTVATSSTRKMLGDMCRAYKVNIAALTALTEQTLGCKPAELKYEVEFKRMIDTIEMSKS